MKSICSLASRCIAIISFGCLACSGALPPAIITSVPKPGISGGGGSYVPTFNTDGRFVVFLSQANNLVINDSTAPVLDLFRYDRMNEQTILVSANVTGIGGGDADSAYASVSADGRLVSFASAAGNLVSGDTNSIRDLFVRDLELRTTIRVSETLPLEDFGMLATVSSFRRGIPRFNGPLISGDGSKVVFESWATNLVLRPDTNNHNDIFIRDLASGITSLVSVNSSDDGAGNGRSEQASMTPDARRVAFLSRATDLVPGTTNALGDIYVRDLDTQTTHWASSNVVQHLPSYRCHPPVLSTNGQVVVFKASAPGAANASVFHVDLSTGVTSLLHTNSPTATEVVISGDGSTVAFDDGEQVFLWQGGVTTLVSKRADGAAPANGNSTSPVLSLDGQIVAYVSTTTDIVTNGVPATNTAYQIYVWNRQTGVTRLVTQNTNCVATVASHQFAHIALSPDGTQIAFDSQASDLVPGDLNAASDIFITPVANNALTLISRRAESLPSLTGMRNVRIAPGCLTADKRFLLLSRLNDYASTGDSSHHESLIIRDLRTGGDEIVATFGEARAVERAISANGRAVAYSARSAGTSSSERGVFWYERATGRRIKLSDSGYDLSISPDGNKVAFRDKGFEELVLFDSQTGTNRIVNRIRREPNPSTPQQLVVVLSPPSFSPDDRWLAFEGYDAYGNIGLCLLELTATNGLRIIPAPGDWRLTRDYDPPAFSADSRSVTAGFGIVDPQAGSYSSVPSVNTAQPRTQSLSADGRYVAREELTNGLNVVVADRKLGTVRVLGIKADPFSMGSPYFRSTSITHDGRYFVFASRATNLVAEDRNGLSDIYLRDLTRDVTILLSSSDAGAAPGNGSSTMPILSADGRTVLFQSFADDLAPGDYNFSRDIFMAHIGGPDSDGDGMEDDWEMAYFSTLSRNGTGDFDSDGASDLAEFRAGTDPTDLGSILRVITVSNLGGGNTRLVWSASPGRTYRVQFKDGLSDDSWREVPTTVTANGTTANWVDDASPMTRGRFYRVVLVQ